MALLFPIYSISVSCITLLCDGICADGFQKRRYTKEDAGICGLCKTTEFGRAFGYVCDGRGLMGNRYGRSHPYVWKNISKFGYYVLNTLVMMAVALSLSYLIGLFVKNSNMLSGIANILSLGMCFLCGVFVPMNIMDRNVLKVSQFLPVYWYENVNETLGSYSHLTGEAAVSVWKGIGLEAMFAVVFVCMILAVTRYQRQK